MTYPSENRPASTPDAATTPSDPAGSGAGIEPVAEPALTPREQVKVTHTRTSAVWAGIWAGVLVLILLIIFIAQNTANVKISFFALEGQISLALAMLIAGVAGAIIAMAVAAFRILQLRRMVRRGR
jgi:uncharacterized integral membrane protein